MFLSYMFLLFLFFFLLIVFSFDLDFAFVLHFVETSFVATLSVVLVIFFLDSLVVVSFSFV